MIPFMKLKWISLSASLLLIAATLYYTFGVQGGFRKGIDFAGGIKLEVEVNELVTTEKLRDTFKKLQIEAMVQQAAKTTRNVVKVELGSQDVESLEEKAKGFAKELDTAGLSLNSVDFLKYQLIQELSPTQPEQVVFLDANHVGPTIGDYLEKSAIKLLLITVALITVYITFRFRFFYAMGAMGALFHDLFMVLGFIGLLQVPLSIPVVVALLTILGYSINDTIVIFDRIRENIENNEKIALEKVVDQSINESISRTLMTSITTLIAIVAVYLLAGEGLRDMSLVLIIGIIIGTYSSSFIASPIVVIWSKVVRR